MTNARPHKGFKIEAADYPLIDKLSDGHRMILGASLTEPNYENLAKALGVNIGTVKSRLNRARTALVAARNG